MRYDGMLTTRAQFTGERQLTLCADPQLVFSEIWHPGLFEAVRAQYANDYGVEWDRCGQWHERRSDFETARYAMLFSGTGRRPTSQSRVMLADVVERFVLRCDARRQFFEEKNFYHTSYGLCCTPMFYVLPDPALCRPERWRSVDADLPPNFVEFESERLRVREELLRGYSGGPDSAFAQWCSAYNNLETCYSPIHAKIQTRQRQNFPFEVNENYMSAAPTEKCVCVLNSTVVLCANCYHCHCTRVPRRPCDPARREGRDNGALIAAGIFGGRYTRRRWIGVLAAMHREKVGSHPIQLFDEFLGAMRRDRHLATLAECVVEFSHLPSGYVDYETNREQEEKRREEEKGALERDFDIALTLHEAELRKKNLNQPLPPPPGTVAAARFGRRQREKRRLWRSRSLPDTKHSLFLRFMAERDQADSDKKREQDHEHERFNAYNPAQVTLAMLLFVEVRQSALWRHAWLLWRSAVLQHCNVCPECFNALRQTLWRLVVYNAMVPILPLRMAREVERLALDFRYSKYG